MAAREESTGVLLVVEDLQGNEYLLYKIHLKDLFYPVPASAAVPRGHATDVRRLPDPVARFKTLPDFPERIDFTLIGGGSTLIGLSNVRRTIVHDTASGASSAGLELRHNKPGGTFVVPLRGGLLALRTRPGLGGEEPFAEALPAAGGGWRAAIPDPPPDFISLTRSKPGCHVTAYAAGRARVWLSAVGRGTYSLEGTAWRKEGDWELPFRGRGLFVPELGAGLCFGLYPLTGRLCVWDMKQSPPAVRYAWEDTMPRWLPKVDLDLWSVARYPEGTLAYLGDGKFCIAWTLALNHRARIIRRAVHLMGVKVSKTSGGRLRMVQHKVCFYQLPSQARMAYALHAHPDAPLMEVSPRDHTETALSSETLMAAQGRSSP